LFQEFRFVERSSYLIIRDLKHGLTSFWVRGRDRFGSQAIGVTAWSAADAMALIREAGFEINIDDVEVQRVVLPHEVEDQNVSANAGPVFFRGIWYPCLNIGWGANGQR
jgi:hypothetical protein